MAGNYGMADPASVMGNVPSYGASVVALSGGVTPARQGGAPANADPRDWLGNPIRSGAIELVDGKGFRRRKGNDANGNPIYQDLTAAERQANGGQYSWDREDQLLSQQRTEKAQQQLAERDAASRRTEQQRWSDELTLKTKGLEGQLESIRQQGANNAAQIELSRLQMQQTSTDRALDRNQQANQFNANLGQQTEQMRLNNKLLEQRMNLEDSHFQQKLAYDKHQSRRAQILGSLTLISQSLARL